MTRLLRLAELHPAQLEERLGSLPALLVPLGTVEWHSHHLPLGLDGLKAEALAAEAARRSGAVLAPTAWWAAGGVPYPYTLRLPGAVIEELLHTALVQFVSMGFRVVCIVNGHYGLENTLATRRAALACMDETDATAVAVADYELLTTLGNRGDHAGVWETSLLWHARSDLVRLEDVASCDPLPGIVGDDPRGRASAELGRRGLEEASERLATMLARTLMADQDERAALQEAAAAGVAALTVLADLRARLPREQVPPVATPAWIAYLEALADGRYLDAKRFAEEKAADPSR